MFCDWWCGVCCDCMVVLCCVVVWVFVCVVGDDGCVWLCWVVVLLF